jgi:hypothetical protein
MAENRGGKHGPGFYVARGLAAAVILAACLASVWKLRSAYGPAPISPPAPITLPAEVNLILDTSASMQGYFSGRTELKDVVASLVSTLDKLEKSNKGVKSIRYELTADSGDLIESNLDSKDFIEKLLNGTPITGQASASGSVRKGYQYYWKIRRRYFNY